MKAINTIKIIMLLGCVCSVLAACDNIGTVGDPVRFHTKKPALAAAIDSLYAKYPEYRVPAKWQQFNNFAYKNPAFIETRVFYFKSPPEEMYYVSLIDDSLLSADTAHSGLAIRAINRGSGVWLQGPDVSFRDEKRINKRFKNAILSKLEAFTHAKAREED